jgi:hypothetical protein
MKIKSEKYVWRASGLKSAAGKAGRAQKPNIDMMSHNVYFATHYILLTPESLCPGCRGLFLGGPYLFIISV